MTRIGLFPFPKLFHLESTCFNKWYQLCQMGEAYRLLFLLFLNSPSSKCVSKSASSTSRPHLNFIPSFHIICVSLMQVSITTHLELCQTSNSSPCCHCCLQGGRREYRKSCFSPPSILLGPTYLLLIQFHVTTSCCAV